MKAIIKLLQELDELEPPPNQLGLPTYYQTISQELTYIIDTLIKMRDYYDKQEREFYQV